MSLRIGINGFGRIGRQVLKAIYDRHHAVGSVVAINDLYDVKTSAHLLEFDSTYGRSPHAVAVTETGVPITSPPLAASAEMVAL